MTLLDPVVIPGDRVSAGDVPDDTLIEDLLEGSPHARALLSLGERTMPDFDEPIRIYELTESR